MKVFSQYEVNELHAGPKAKVDVERILKEKYNASIQSLKIKNNIYKKIPLLCFRVKKILFLLRNRYGNDIAVFQLPFNKSRKFGVKTNKTIGFIHDIDGIRNLDEPLLNIEIEQYQKFDVIISHNSIMTDFLIKHGVKTPIINLDIFDYLVSDNVEVEHKKRDISSKQVVFAGNFNKSLFLNELDEKKMKFSINLYGVGKYNDNNKKYNYCGSFLPDELPLMMEGNLGLVWDGGTAIDDDNINNYLNYTKYNNPHKLSCYIAAGLPVIVWEKAACAKFVKDNNIGYTISNLYDINNIDLKDYNEKLKNVKRIKERLTSGYYTVKAMDKALKIVSKK